MRRVIAATAVALLVGGAAYAQEGDALGQALASEAKGNERNMVSAAEAMPADKYEFKFETNTFGQMIFHAAMANNMLCSMMAGDKAPETPVKATGGKEALIDQMKKSFDYCQSVFPKVTAAHLSDKASFMRRDVTVAWVVLHAAADWGDHYAQVARMLRANGIVPPSAERTSHGQ